MTTNNDRHEWIREQLPLAAAGALSSDESTEVMQHAARCDSCRSELELWGSYATGLRQLPQPVVPADLFYRTRRRVIESRAEALERRRNALMLGALVVFSWVTSFGSWVLVRALTGGTLELLGTNVVDAGPWMVISTTLTWLTAGVAAVTLGNQGHSRRFQ